MPERVQLKKKPVVRKSEEEEITQEWPVEAREEVVTETEETTPEEIDESKPLTIAEKTAALLIEIEEVIEGSEIAFNYRQEGGQ